MHLYELTQEIRDIENTDDESLAQALESIKGDFKATAIGIAKYIKELEAESLAVESEAKRLADKKRIIENRIDRIEKYLMDNMLIANIQKIEDPIVRLVIRTNPPSVIVKDVMLLPEKYRKLIPESWQADKTSIINDFKATGEIPEGAEIITDKKRIEIK